MDNNTKYLLKESPENDLYHELLVEIHSQLFKKDLNPLYVEKHIFLYDAPELIAVSNKSIVTDSTIFINLDYFKELTKPPEKYNSVQSSSIPVIDKLVKSDRTENFVTLSDEKLINLLKEWKYDHAATIIPQFAVSSDTADNLKLVKDFVKNDLPPFLHSYQKIIFDTQVSATEKIDTLTTDFTTKLDKYLTVSHSPFIESLIHHVARNVMSISQKERSESTETKTLQEILWQKIIDNSNKNDLIPMSTTAFRHLIINEFSGYADFKEFTSRYFERTLDPEGYQKKMETERAQRDDRIRAAEEQTAIKNLKGDDKYDAYVTSKMKR